MDIMENFLLLNYVENRRSWSNRKRKILIAIAAATRRRKRLLKTQYLIVNKMLQNNDNRTRRFKSCRRFFRNKGWWETVESQYNDTRFKEIFRVTRETFNFILSKIRVDIEKQVTSETPVSSEMRCSMLV